MMSKSITYAREFALHKHNRTNITLQDAGNKEDGTSVYLLTKQGKYSSRRALNGNVTKDPD